jgi:hypothetical protein
MPLFRLPLSGDVVQWINPMTWFLSGNRVNVYLGESSDPETEAAVLDHVGTYGRQLGQITDAVAVLLKHLPDRRGLSEAEQAAVNKFEAMAAEIAAIKSKRKRRPLHP